MLNSQYFRNTFLFSLFSTIIMTSIATLSQAAVGSHYVESRITLAQLDPPRNDTLPPPENQRCVDYAHNALADYETMRRFPQCSIPDSPRWQSNFPNHYQWCLTARPEWLGSETRAREDHLKQCGVRRSF